jgi:hypothetical protein
MVIPRYNLKSCFFIKELLKMAEQRYHIIFKGEIAKGESIEDVKKRLASLFNIQASKVESFFSNHPIVIKKDVDYETCVRFKQAFKKAGARIRIVPLDNSTHGKAKKGVRYSQEPETENNTNIILNGKPKIVSPKLATTSLIYTPLPGHHIEGWSEGIDFKRQYINKVPFEQLLLVSVFKKADIMEEKLLILIFIKGHERPVIVNADSIRYSDFSSVSAQNTVSSLRNFVIFLFNQNHSLIVDEYTYDFMLSTPPHVYEKELTIISTALALEIENDIKPKREKKISQQTILRMPSVHISDTTQDSDSEQKKESPHKEEQKYSSNLVICPQCGHKKEKSKECKECGTIFKKYTKSHKKRSKEKRKFVQNSNVSAAVKHKAVGSSNVSSDNIRKGKDESFLKKFLSLPKKVKKLK